MPGEPAGDSSGCNNSSCKFPLPLHYFLAVLSTGVEGRVIVHFSKQHTSQNKN